MTRDEFDRPVGRKARRGKIGPADRPPFITSSGIEAVSWWVPNRAAAWTVGPGVILVSLPRLRCLEVEMRA